MRTIIPLLLLAIALPLQAQEPAGPADPQAAATAADPQPAPVIRAARLAWFHGDLQVQRADNTASTPTSDNPNPEAAVVNMPITEGSRLVTGDGAEAEIEFEDGSVVRLTPKTALTVDALTTDGKIAETQLSLLGGLAYFELRHAPSAAYTISAGTILAAPADNVVFRIALDEPPALVSVLSGSLNVSADANPDDSSKVGFTATVRAGESLHADPDDPARYFLNPQLAENTWDDWNQARDTAAAADAATRTTARDDYAGTQGYGWSDLDANGTWYTVTNPDGSTSELWQPAIAADANADASAAADAGDYADGFDPYDDGAFVYAGGAYYWASSYSWGWLPYRCGRWNYYPGFGWAWTPNRFCHVWGFGGGGGINIGRHPQRYKVIHFPPITPVHPIIRVHTGDPHPPTRPRDNPVPVKIAGNPATPLLPVPAPGVPASGMMGGSLYRDYPVHSETHKPIFGSVAPPVTEPSLATGWVAPPPRPDLPRVVRTPVGSSSTRPAGPGRASAPAPASASRPAAPPAPAPRSVPAPAPAAPSKPK
jgi:hypothetical protein